MIAIIDCGIGNIASVERAIVAAGGEDVRRVTTARELEGAERIVFPGQGAFHPVMEWLRSTGIAPELKMAVVCGRPYLGVCLGMQVLFDGSDEGEPTAGLGMLPGEVRRLPAMKLPHTGWNRVVDMGSFPNHSGGEMGYMYFVHSYAVVPPKAAPPPEWRFLSAGHEGEMMVAWYEDHAFLAGLRWGRNLVTQFHPEKSGKAGAALIEEWMRS